MSHVSVCFSHQRQITDKKVSHLVELQTVLLDLAVSRILQRLAMEGGK